jgi:hypothetical protein
MIMEAKMRGSDEPRADRPGRITLGADEEYDAADFVKAWRSMSCATVLWKTAMCNCHSSM